MTRTGPAGRSGRRNRIRINQTNQRTIGFCLVTRKDKVDFCVYPHVWLTFSWGNIGMTLTSDSANERHCLCHPYPHSKNTGCGGVPAPNLALKRRTRIIIILYLSIGKPLCLENLVCTRDRNAASPRLEPGPQGARGGESRIRINQPTKQRAIGFCLVTRISSFSMDIRLFG